MRAKVNRVLLFAAVALLVIAVICACSPSGSKSLSTARVSGLPTAGTDKASICLKDNWHVYSDHGNVGEADEWYTGFYGKGTVVSLPYETSPLAYISTFWFSNVFTADIDVQPGQRVFADFEGVQYYAKVWLNGNFIGEHEGSYGKFSFDVTDFIREGEENLLAIRLYAPKNGDTFNGLAENNLPTWLGGYQHIQTPVYISVVPDVAIADTHVTPVYESGEINVDVTLDNPFSTAVNVDLDLYVTPDGRSEVLDSACVDVKAEPGLSTHTVSVTVDDFRAWSPDDPYLYNVTVNSFEEGAEYADTSTCVTGFKDLRVDDEGFFILNGERIYIKSTHVVAWVIGSIDVGTDIERQLAQLDYLKASGYNTIRTLDGPALPEMLDYCDRIGLLVYEETAMSWTQLDCDKTEELFRREVMQLLQRDRNHPSFAIIGMLNETFDAGNTTVRVQAAVDCLDLIREYDSDILALLSSGRWDNRLDTGSASNPGSLEWDGFMGNEGMEDPEKDPQFNGMGDVHFYPRMPYDANIRRIIATIGGNRATFFSEAGAGSQPNIISTYRVLEQESNIAKKDYINQSTLKQIDVLYELFDRFDLYKAFASPEAMLIETQRQQSSQRALFFDYIRSNPNINGYSVTMGSDVGYRGEGVLETDMDYKSDMFTAMTEGWAPLRWCLNFETYQLYADQSLDAEIYLSDFDVLEDKDYKAVFSIVGADGQKWSKEVTVHPEFDENGRAPLSTLVLDEEIPLTGLSAGEYEFCAVLEGETVTAGSKKFWVSDPADYPKLSGTVYHSGLSEAGIALLEKLGVTVLELDPANIQPGSTVLLCNSMVRHSTLEALYESARTTGTHVIGLNSDTFGDWGQLYLPFEEPGYILNSNNWLYHYDSIMLDTSITEGFEGACVMDPLYFETVYPAKQYTQMTEPDEMHVFAIFVGNNGGESGAPIKYGTQMGTYNWGEGYITINTLEIAENLGTPVADRLLVNLVAYLNTDR